MRMQYKSGWDRNLDNTAHLQAILASGQTTNVFFGRDFVKCSMLVPLKGVCMRTAFHNNGPFKLLWTHSI